VFRFNPPMTDKTPDTTAAATKRAEAAVSSATDRAGDNTPTQPGSEASKAASGTNETLRDAAKEPESEESVLLEESDDAKNR
jgi:hypothetical protein